MKAFGRERATLADGLPADAEPSERVAPATARAVTCSDFAGSIGSALSDSESGDPKPTPSQTDGRRLDDVEMLSETTNSLTVVMFVGPGWSTCVSCIRWVGST